MRIHFNLQRRIYPTLIFIFLQIQDAYIDFTSFIIKYWLLFIIFACKFYLQIKKIMSMFMQSNRTQLLYANIHNTTNDITTILRCFYSYDKILSCASLQRWLANFGYKNITKIDIVVCCEGIIYEMRINLHNEEEEITERDLPFGDISLSQLEKRILS